MLEALGAGAVAGDRDRAALVAAARRPLAVAAVMARELSAARAARARRRSSGTSRRGRSRGSRGSSTSRAVEQHDRLAAARARTSASASRSAGGAMCAPRMSRISTGGSGRPSTRLGRRSRVSATTLSGRGVALPASSTAPCCARPADGDRAGVVARVPLVLVGRVVLLVDDDQADVGERREHRRARPDARPAPRPRAAAATRRGARPRPSPEWSTATTSPNRAWNRPTVCGVSAISGTSTIAPRPAASVSCTARRYTSVLPDPVTPWSRNRRAGARPQRAEDRVERGLLLAGQRRHAGEPPADRHRSRAAPLVRQRHRHEAAPLEPAQHRGAERGRHRGAVALERLERGPLAVVQRALRRVAPARPRR